MATHSSILAERQNTRPDTPEQTQQGPCDLSQIRLQEVRSRTLRFLPQIQMRPTSIAPNPEESREASPKSTVSLTSQRHPETLPEVTGTNQGNPGFPAAWEGGAGAGRGIRAQNRGTSSVGTKGSEEGRRWP